MKKVNALTLIEVLLVLAVIALIMLAAINQIQRYQSNRNIHQAKTTVQSLSVLAVNLYLANCNTLLLASPKVNTTCVAGGASTSPFCTYPPTVVNPFYKKSSNYVFQIILMKPDGTPLPMPQIMVGLPFASAGTSFSPTSSQIKTQLGKYIAALQPTLIVTKSAYYEPNGKVAHTAAPKSDACLSNTGASLCFEWIITPENWGSLSTGSTNNQAQDVQLNATVAQYVPIQSAYTSMKGYTVPGANGGKTQAGCAAIIAKQYQASQHNS
ncbi:MAG: type II secretion system protein [Legionellales bacterium]|nr:type II secretion system protein [Legionellales bacterium]